MTIPNTTPLPQGARGFTLIEVLVTVVIVAVGLLGFAALQSVALKNSRTALHHSYATFFAYDIVDRMRANRSAAIQSADYNSGFLEAPTGGTVADDDVATWKGAIADNLPNGQAEVTVDGQGNALIVIRWDEGWAQQTELEPNWTTFTTQTNL